MQLTSKQKLIYSGQLCPYCGRPTVLDKNDFGRIYICRPCDAYVGCHHSRKNGDRPLALGRVAKLDLRQKRMEAHKWFDTIWQMNYMDRKSAYWYLSTNLGLPKDYTHISWLDHLGLDWVIYLSKKYLAESQGVLVKFKEPENRLSTM